MKNKKNESRLRRKKSIRKNVFGTGIRPRLSVFRSNLHIYAQLIDDESGRTLLSASSAAKELSEGNVENTENMKGKTGVSFNVGVVLGKKILENNIESIVFDRNGYLYHGRVKALADGVRKAGVKF
ncbi:MAG: 50S ribosomal protein L18 [Candidatus Delongbacteria bacterium]|jgi:large subunit ribosomal protein L18|nr:50S ribosomal protein L18 [Candidatus Delongbacteria bacterium]MDD4204537.1 50S ribosomal protein L18 [Candidatus Delongbacteria bacterium]MDY0017475.1 50S ribosomal protein L18 [Candidatus Delongbacteria bacterium]